MQLLRPVCDATGAPGGWQLQQVALPPWAAFQHTAAVAAEAAIADEAVSAEPSDSSAPGVPARYTLGALATTKAKTWNNAPYGARMTQNHYNCCSNLSLREDRIFALSAVPRSTQAPPWNMLGPSYWFAALNDVGSMLGVACR